MNRFRVRYSMSSWVTGYHSEQSLMHRAVLEKPYEISLPESSLSLTSSLYCALKRICKTDETIALWMDAICINQDNDREKGHQARFTKEISGTPFKSLFISEEKKTPVIQRSRTSCR
jgi:hypothetical protein